MLGWGINPSPRDGAQSWCSREGSRTESPAASKETQVWHTFDASAGSALAFSSGISSRLTSGFAASFSILEAATTSFEPGLAGPGSAAWLCVMAGAEVGRGLLSGVITATAEDGGQRQGQGSELVTFLKHWAKSFQITALLLKMKGRRRGEKKGKEIKMLSKAACAFSMGKLRLFPLWFK